MKRDLLREGLELLEGIGKPEMKIKNPPRKYNSDDLLKLAAIEDLLGPDLVNELALASQMTWPVSKINSIRDIIRNQTITQKSRW